MRHPKSTFIWKPLDPHAARPFAPPRRQSIEQLTLLFDAFRQISRVIMPTPENAGAYGSETRNLLMLSCMECEVHWRAMLKHGGLVKSTYNTRDYVLLADPYQLRNKKVRFLAHPLMPDRKPFINWSPSGNPTRDLPWYDAYNATKHDREMNFSKATLDNVMDALGAVYILFLARFGKFVMADPREIGHYLRPINDIDEDLGD